MKAPSRRFSVSRTVAVLLALCLIGGTIALGGGAAEFVNIPAFLLTCGLTFLLLLGTFGSDFLKFLPDSILTLFATPSEPVPRYADIARFGSRYAIAGAAIATVVGLVQMLSNLSDPSSIGHGMAVSLQPILYALVLSEVIFALLYKVYSDGGEPEDSPPLAVRTLVIVLIGMAVFIATFFLMMCIEGTVSAPD